MRVVAAQGMATSQGTAALGTVLCRLEVLSPVAKKLWEETSTSQRRLQIATDSFSCTLSEVQHPMVAIILGQVIGKDPKS